jgi:hypothetical protein
MAMTIHTTLKNGERVLAESFPQVSFLSDESFKTTGPFVIDLLTSTLEECGFEVLHWWSADGVTEDPLNFTIDASHLKVKNWLVKVSGCCKSSSKSGVRSVMVFEYLSKRGLTYHLDHSQPDTLCSTLLTTLRDIWKESNKEVIK